MAVFENFRKSGFTLIEILITLLIILILASLLIPKVIAAKEKANRVSCARKIRSLTQALCIYSSLDEGYLRNFSESDGAEEIYGALFQKNGWTELKDLVCPGNKEGVPPAPCGYGYPLDRTSASIDYWVVFTRNTHGASNEINTLLSPGNNVLVIESFDMGGADTGWTAADYHQNGGNAGRMNGSVSFEQAIPQNKDDSGTAEIIKKNQCSF